jgi:hypothetical protein
MTAPQCLVRTMRVNGKRILDPQTSTRLVVRRGSPPSAGDIAQARLFDNILHDEIAKLRELAAAINARAVDRDELQHHKELRRVNARINEVLRMLDALRDRFPAT